VNSISGPKIDSYRFGRIVIDGEAYTKDVIILPDGVIPNWWRDEGHRLKPGDLERVLDAGPKTLVVGQGAYGRMGVDVATRQLVAEAGVELIELSTSEAVERYNQLRDRGDVAAALHLTC